MNVLLLLSGGIDSPVAGKLLTLRGNTVHAVHYTATPITSSAPEEKSEHLAQLIPCKTLTIINISELLLTIRNKCRHEHYYVHMKRFMLNIAERLAKETGCEALATGESIGQVGSQTLNNLSVITAATTIPVLRPLLAKNKQEIITLAKKYGTLETSTGPESCDALGPKHPSTKAKQHLIEREESQLDSEQLITEALNTRKTVSILPFKLSQHFKTPTRKENTC